MPQRKHVVNLIIVGLVLPIAAALAGEPQRPGLTLQDRAKRLFPNATSISSKEATPPHFKIFDTGADGKPKLAGVAFLTTEIEPLERGYDGPIKILVGMDVAGKLTGVDVVEHREPYGYFSVETPQFVAQFVGKDIRDPFRVGMDVDAISRASITMNSAARAIRNSARRVARLVLTPPER
jgi:NosR/NirI family nitrous oxide reductase transcriptional regulator